MHSLFIMTMKHLTCFRLKKGRATYFRPETIIASFLHSMVLLPKVLFNHSFLKYRITSSDGLSFSVAQKLLTEWDEIFLFETARNRFAVKYLSVTIQKFRNKSFFNVIQI